MTKSFISIDVETNGLDGQPYAVAMVLYRKGKAVDFLHLACPIEGEVNDWIKKNKLEVVPAAEQTTYSEMLSKAASFYKKYACTNDDGVVVQKYESTNYNATPVLYHCGMIVEGGFFQILHNEGLLGTFERPMAPIEVADYLRMANSDPYSVDSYVAKRSIAPTVGAVHDPMFDAIQAAKDYLHIVGLMEINS